MKVTEQAISRFMRALKHAELNMHSVLICSEGELVCERYWAPFTPEKTHRMYSVTKSFVAMAVGCLLDEGKIALDDPIVKYFPDKQPAEIHPFMQAQTIRHMLMMSTCFTGFNWFLPGVVDRTAFYFAQKPSHLPGTLFHYDSTGSYILGALVERLSGMKLLDYMKEKFLNRIGGFESAQILDVPDGVAWGDSAMICTPRALLNFAKLVMNGGSWEGEQLISADYVREASGCRITNDLEGSRNYNDYGYGYQIWMTEQNGFSFNGMGSQFAVCVPEKDFIFVCTGDNQYNPYANPRLFASIFDILIPDDGEDCDELTLSVAHGEADAAFAAEINGRTFTCDENPMGIKRFRFEFDGDGGCWVYENAQGEKRLPFGMKRNVFCKFPQLGYSDDRGNVHDTTSGFMYDCAVSAGWTEPKKLQLRVQITDRYFGSFTATFGFVDETKVSFTLLKHAEDFLQEYHGIGTAYSC